MEVFQAAKRDIEEILGKYLGQEYMSKMKFELDTKFADIAITCFFGTNFQESAKNVYNILHPRTGDSKLIKEIVQAGPYVNVRLNWDYVAQNLPELLKEQKPRKKNNQTVIVEYSSPNIAKPMHIGHLTNTVIGNSIYNFYKFLGYKTIGINYLGDWGTHFGKLIVAYKKWGSAPKLKKNTIDEMLSLYVRVSAAAKEDPSIEEDARRWFKKLEDGDKEALTLWKMFYNYSVKDFNRLYKILDVRFDIISGEKEFSKAGQEIVEHALEMGVAKESDGAIVIELGKFGLPDMLIRKSDGATTYETRDLAVIEHRANKYKFAKNMYVVASEQKTRFNQLFKSASLIGILGWENSVHVYYGFVLGPDGKKFSTREGKIVKAEDVLNEAIERVTKIIDEKNPKLKNKKKVALQVGIGAIKYMQLAHSREKDVIFDWNRVLSFEGNSGPYLQYTYARAMSIIGKSKKKVSVKGLKNCDELERSVVKKISKFSLIVEKSAREYSPNALADYAYDLASEFNKYYNSVTVIGSANEKEKLSLVLAVAETIKNCLNLLGIDAPKEM